MSTLPPILEALSVVDMAQKYQLGINSEEKCIGRIEIEDPTNEEMLEENATLSPKVKCKIAKDFCRSCQQELNSLQEDGSELQAETINTIIKNLKIFKKQLCDAPKNQIEDELYIKNEFKKLKANFNSVKKTNPSPSYTEAAKTLATKAFALIVSLIQKAKGATTLAAQTLAAPARATGNDAILNRLTAPPQEPLLSRVTNFCLGQISGLGKLSDFSNTRKKLGELVQIPITSPIPVTPTTPIRQSNLDFLFGDSASNIDLCARNSLRNHLTATTMHPLLQNDFFERTSVRNCLNASDDDKKLLKQQQKAEKNKTSLYPDLDTFSTQKQRNASSSQAAAASKNLTESQKKRIRRKQALLKPSGEATPVEKKGTFKPSEFQSRNPLWEADNPKQTDYSVFKEFSTTEEGEESCVIVPSYKSNPFLSSAEPKSNETFADSNFKGLSAHRELQGLKKTKENFPSSDLSSFTQAEGKRSPNKKRVTFAF